MSNNSSVFKKAAASFGLAAVVFTTPAKAFDVTFGDEGRRQVYEGAHLTDYGCKVNQTNPNNWLSHAYAMPGKDGSPDTVTLVGKEGTVVVVGGKDKKIIDYHASQTASANTEVAAWISQSMPTSLKHARTTIPTHCDVAKRPGPVGLPLPGYIPQ